MTGIHPWLRARPLSCPLYQSTRAIEFVAWHRRCRRANRRPPSRTADCRLPRAPTPRPEQLRRLRPVAFASNFTAQIAPRCSKRRSPVAATCGFAPSTRVCRASVCRSTASMRPAIGDPVRTSTAFEPRTKWGCANGPSGVPLQNQLGDSAVGRDFVQIAGAAGHDDRAIVTPSRSRTVRRVANRNGEASFGRNFLEFPVGNEANPRAVRRKEWGRRAFGAAKWFEGQTVSPADAQAERPIGVEERATIWRQRNIGAADDGEARRSGNRDRVSPDLRRRGSAVPAPSP